jgi:cation diffusion facilitator CzcD-associated flavoprotein CzcO
MSEHLDVLIVGAGISGIAAAWYLRRDSPRRSFAILEARERIGGTWDLFRYPGVRSDSDLYTFGYSFRPWTAREMIAEGAAIRTYLEETARKTGIDRAICFGTRVIAAHWNSDEARWRVEVEAEGARRTLTCSFLHFCTGYFDYARGHAPDWPGMAEYGGRIVHPQAWPEDLDWAGKRVAVIGSGATAVTLVPALAEAAQVTMVQRSPSFIAALPSEDGVVQLLRRLGPRAGHVAARWKNILQAMFFYTLSRRRPDLMRRILLKGARAGVGDGVDIGTHFNPTYQPWDQRLCVDKDGIFFRALREGRAEIVTGRIETFTGTGLRLASGREIDADIVVTATGLRLQIMGGVRAFSDGREIEPAQHFLYKGMMLTEVPNHAYSVGYTNASWTLRCELIAAHVARILNHMERTGTAIVTARPPGRDEGRPVIDLESGYVKRALDRLPKQGARMPWRVHQNYLRDLWDIGRGRVDDPALDFAPAPAALRAHAAE